MTALTAILYILLCLFAAWMLIGLVYSVVTAYIVAKAHKQIMKDMEDWDNE